MTKECGINVSVMMIYGFPTETKEDRRAGFRLIRSMGVDMTKANNLIPYPGTPIYNDVCKNSRMIMETEWRNFNSTLSLTRSIFDKTPLAYVPETTSEFELKREIIRYNLLNAVSLRTLGNILRRNEGVGRFRLPARWYLKPRELMELTTIAFILSINLLVALLPLWMTEPLMNAHNPAMRRRSRVAGYDAASHHASKWDKELTRNLNRLVKWEKNNPKGVVRSRI